jgi:hypothetical protein
VERVIDWLHQHGIKEANPDDIISSEDEKHKQKIMKH